MSDLYLMGFFSPSLVLCLLRSSMMKVVLGEHSINTMEGFEQIFSVSAIIQHYNYKPWSFNNDIMLIKVWKESVIWYGTVWNTYIDV